MIRDDLEAELFGALFLLSQHLNRGADDALASFGLTGRQWLLLAVLVKAFPDSEPTVSQAAAVYGTSRQNVKQLALQLRSRGFLTLEPDPGDRRATRLKLTARHRELDEPGAVAVQRRFLASTFAGLDDQEVEVLHGLVRRLVGAGEGSR